MPVTPEAVVRISLFFNINRQIAIYSDQERSSLPIPSLDRSSPAMSFSTKNKNATLLGDVLFFVVKVRRVELLSESISTRLSPSAANVLFVSPLIAPVSRLYRWLAYCSPGLLGAHTEFSCIIDARFLTYR